MACPSEFSDLLTGFLPAIIVAGLVTTLATSHESSMNQRVTALVIATATHALYGIGDLLFDDTDFDVVTVSDSGTDTWITDIYTHLLIFDIALVAAGAAELWAQRIGIVVADGAASFASLSTSAPHSPPGAVPAAAPRVAQSRLPAEDDYSTDGFEALFAAADEILDYSTDA